MLSKCAHFVISKHRCCLDEFNIYTREAGAGELSVSLEGPSKAILKVKDRGHGYSTASYVVSKPGQ